MKWTVGLFFSILVFTQLASAQPESVSFSENEKQWHLKRLPRVLSIIAKCLEGDLKKHQVFYAEWGISPYYGDNSLFSKLSYEAKKEHLRELGKPEHLVDLLQPTSCIGITMKCMERGFKLGGQLGIWKKLKKVTVANGLIGTSLQEGLQSLGWTVLYWNPDVAQNVFWDEQEKIKFPDNKLNFWGHHEYRWTTVRTKGTYYFNRVDDATSLVNFGITIPEGFTKIPFYVGTAHTGYHVFPGSFGQVIEGHSMRPITDPQTVESSPFNPLKSGGGPRGAYRSGLIAIPPGY